MQALEQYLRRHGVSPANRSLTIDDVRSMMGGAGESDDHVEDIEQLEHEIDMLGDYLDEDIDAEETLGGLKRLRRRADALDDKAKQADSKASRARSGSLRNRWFRRVGDKARRKSEDKRRKIDTKEGRLRAKLGEPIPEDVRRDRQWREREDARDAALADTGTRFDQRSTPPAGMELPLPFELAGSPTQLIGVGAGPAPPPFAINLTTRQITYAGFVVYGIKVSIRIAPGNNAQGFYNGDVLPTCIIDTCNVDGGFNCVYAPTPVQFVSQGGTMSASAMIYPSQTAPGFRDNPPLSKNNRATLTGRFISNIATANGYNAIFESVLILRRRSDDFVDRNTCG